MYGSREAECEVQRTIKLTAFLCLLKKVIGPIKVHVDNKVIRHGSWREERKCIDPKALHLPVSKEISVEVEHVKAHRSKKDKKEMSHFEKFFNESNEKEDELAKEGAMLDESFMAETRAKTVQQEREEV